MLRGDLNEHAFVAGPRLFAGITRQVPGGTSDRERMPEKM